MLLRVPKSLEVPSLHKHTKIVKQGSSNLFKQGSTIPLKQGSLRLQGSHSGLHILLCLSHTSWLIVIRMGRLLPIIRCGQIIACYLLFVDAAHVRHLLVVVSGYSPVDIFHRPQGSAAISSRTRDMRYILGLQLVDQLELGLM